MRSFTREVISPKWVRPPTSEAALCETRCGPHTGFPVYDLGEYHANLRDGFDLAVLFDVALLRYPGK
jgi:hypothetical protein